MADVFISYVRRDKHRVTPLVAALRCQGFEVWWDDDIPADAPWETTIERALFGATAVIVCWSSFAVASDNVRAEARWARAEGRLLQIFLDACDPPLFFGERQGVDLSGWNGDPNSRDFARVATRLREMLNTPPSGPAIISSSVPRRIRNVRHWITGGTLVVGLCAAAFFMMQRPVVRTASRIAVLPFTVAAADLQATSFAQTLTEQIVAGLNSGEVPAVSRADAATLRGSDNAARLNQLGVGLVFDGGVERDGDTLDVQIHVDDPRGHVTIWSNSDQGSLADLNQLRARVTKTVVGVVACSHRALQPSGLTEPQLLGRYLHACDLFVNHGDAASPQATFELLDNLRAVTRDAPKFVAARTDLAKFDAYLAPLMPADQAASMRVESASQATAALALDPNAPDAYLAQEMLLPPTDWRKRETLLRKAVANDPAWPHTNGFLAQLLAETGRMREASVYVAHAAAADLQIDWRPFSAWLTCTAGRTAPTIDDLRARLIAQPGDDALTNALENCFIDAGRYGDARALRQPPTTAGGTSNQPIDSLLQAMISRTPADIATARRAALALAAQPSPFAVKTAIEMLSLLDDVDDAFATAEHYRPGWPMTGIVAFIFGPRSANLRRDSRFMTLMDRYGLTAFWRATGKWPDFCNEPGLPYRCDPQFPVIPVRSARRQ